MSEGSRPQPGVPGAVRLHFGRAAVQTIADREHIDILHIKGDAVDRSLRSPEQVGSDVDILVRPDHVGVLDAKLRLTGWVMHSTFEGGSPFGHAQTYHHAEWGFLDLHRWFPGVRAEPAVAFEHLWRRRREMVFGGVACAVPDVPAQAVVLLLNAARARHPEEVDRVWHDADADRRSLIEAEVDALDARLAFDTALGNIELHRHDREYRLWRAVSQHRGRMEEWWGRFVAAPTPAARLRIVARAPRVNIEHLAIELGHPPSRGEVVREFFARPFRGILEVIGRGGKV